MECRHCKQPCIKYGKQVNGRQRYYCRSCCRHQQLEYRYHACKPGIDSLIPKLLCNSVGINSMARVLAISSNTVMKKIKAIAGSIPKPPIPLNRQSFEIDELRTFIGKKQHQYWVAYCLCSETKQVVDFVVGKRSKRMLKMIVDTALLSGVEVIKTDRLNIYQALIPRERHISNAYNINHIECHNLNLRTHLKRLGRRTICYGKSIILLTACLRIYFWYATVQ